MIRIYMIARSVGITLMFAALLSTSVLGQTVGGKLLNADFSPEMAKQFGWSLKKGDKEYYRLGQRVGRDGQNIVGVAVYGGLPFKPLSLRVDGELDLPLVIRVVAFQDEQLIPTEESLVPLYENFDPQTGKLTSKLFTQAANVTWQFIKPGIEFNVSGTAYKADKEGASITFTKTAVRMKGIKKTSAARK